jgi:hypothetical protein
MKKIAILLFATLFLFFSDMFGKSPEGNRYKKTIETNRAKEVKTDIDFFAGELTLTGNSKELAECFYGYGDEFIRPNMTYHEVGKTGYLRIDSEPFKDKDIDDFDDNEWFLSLNPDIANSLAIKLKAGEANIDLEGCKINRFEFRMMAGESNVNLRNTSVKAIVFNLMTGEANLNLTGKWYNDLEASIKGGVGELDIKVPYNIGVRITVSGLIGEVNIPFFNRNGKTFTNDLYGKTEHTLYLNIEAGIGEVNVEMVE